MVSVLVADALRSIDHAVGGACLLMSFAFIERGGSRRQYQKG